MILYFSGTGNSEYLAKLLAEDLDDEIVNLFSYIKEGKCGEFISEKPFVLVSPTYSWRVPRVLSKYLMDCDFKGSRDFYVVINYGDSCGNAYKYIKDAALNIGLNFRGLYGLKMPENYIMLFDLDGDDINRKIIAESRNQIKSIAKYIRNKEDFPEKKVGLVGKFQSAVINPIFFKFIVKDKKFYANDKCVSCGICERVCVLNNISYNEGRPIWHGNCTHCSACISKCPKGAIEYGKKTVGKTRYLLENIVKTDN